MTPQQLVNDVKKDPQFKYKYEGWTDIDIYEDLQKQYPDIAFPVFSTPRKESKLLKDADTSPGVLEWLGTVSLAETGVEGGWFGGAVTEDFTKSV